MIGLLLALTQPSFLENADFSAGIKGWNIAAEIEWVNGPSGARAIRIPVTKAGGNAWDTQLQQPIGASLTKDRSYRVTFWARSEAGFAFVGNLQQLGGSWTSLGSANFKADSTWRPFSFSGTPSVDYRPGETQLAFHVGTQTGTVEFANIQMKAEAASTGPKNEPILTPETPFETERSDIVTISGEKIKFNPPADASPWTANVRKTAQVEIKSGDTIVVEAEMRSGTKSKVGVMYELSRPPHTKDVNEQVVLRPEWSTYRFGGVASSNYMPTESRLVLFLGYGKGEIEVRNLRVTNRGKTPLKDLNLTRDFWAGAVNTDAWKKAANERIEKLRKADLEVVVTRNGRPVSGATVRVDQVQHAFRFGTAVTADLLTGESEEAKKYREIVEKNFNAAVFENDMKWGFPTDVPKVKRALDWMDARGFQIRGHNLTWGAERYIPGDIVRLNSADRWKAIQERVRNQMDTFKGRVFVWDVVNEPVHEQWLWQQDGADLFGKIHRLARQTDPKVKLCLNEYNWTEENQTGPGELRRLMAYAKAQIEAGVPIDTIGLQCHVGLPVTPLARVLEIMDEVSKLGKPLEITEYDLVCDDDDFHGKYTADYLRAAFSHPNVESFLVWGFWEKAHWMGPKAAMVRADFSERPAMKAWRDQIYREWWTKFSGRSDAAGKAGTRAFLGQHKVTVTVGGATATATVQVQKGKNRVTVTL
jgi:endo-1,4-beta-xylanase